MTEFLHLFAVLIFLHLLADYPLQGDFLAKAKNPVSPIPGVPWQTAMASHCGIHGGMVFLATGSLLLGLLEFSLHCFTDVRKCRGELSFNQDQILHLACKFWWAVLATLGILHGF